jgi:isopentenyl-diphosphate Delta-isomerase
MAATGRNKRSANLNDCNTSYLPAVQTFYLSGALVKNGRHGIDDYRRVVDMVQADALYLHLNPLQEALQPGGDTDFRQLASKIQYLVARIGVPVFVKEVGHGISGSIAARLFALGVQGVDVAGVGGTSYAWVEAERSHNEAYAQWFKSFGVPTDRAIGEAARARTSSGQLVIASGGIRSPLDGLKSRALGADLFSAAVPFLRPAMDSSEVLIATIKNWQQGLKIAMFASAASDWNVAKQVQLTRSIGAGADCLPAC